MMNQIKNVALGILTLFVGFSIFNHFDNKKLYKENLATYQKVLDDTVRFYVVQNDKLKFEKEAIAVEKGSIESALTYADEDIKSLKKEVGSLNNIIVYQKNLLEARDTVYTTHRDTVYVEEGVGQTALTFDWTNNHLSINNAFISLDGSRRVIIPYKYKLDFKSITYIDRRFLKKNRIVTKYEFSDPNLVPVTSTTIYAPYRKKFYEKFWFQGGVGLILGIIITK